MKVAITQNKREPPFRIIPFLFNKVIRFKFTFANHFYYVTTFLKPDSVSCLRLAGVRKIGFCPEKGFRADGLLYRLYVRCLKANGKGYRHESAVSLIRALSFAATFM
jgi:hypothetical protein